MPRKTDHTMVEAITKRWGNHSSFMSGGMDHAGFPTFTVNHYSCPVTYSVQNFLEKNLDALNPDFVIRPVNATQRLPISSCRNDQIGRAHV